MQTNTSRHRNVACTAAFLGCLFLSAASSAELPVTHVTLYKNGIAFFEREGTVAAGEEARLQFQSDEMNDLLKSLIVTDSAGIRITSVRYDANETLQQRLSKFPFHLGDQQPLSAFLDSLKGSRIELTADGKTVTGSIVGARVLSAPNAPPREQITVLTEAGNLANYDLGSVSTVRLLDPMQQADLKRYLAAWADSMSHDERNVFIESNDKQARQLHASYIVPAAIWKSSYRLSLNPKTSRLEGWAIVDNTSGDDWNNVQLAVVSGRPISFISPLDTARYGQRAVVDLPEDQAANPQVYGGAVGGASAGLVTDEAMAPAPPPSAKKAMPMSSGRQFVANQLMAPRQESAEVSTVAGASGATVGELFEYNFDTPVTVKKNQSAMLPFLQDSVGARKLLIYTEQDNQHPVNAAELSNTTGKTLDGGPVTVYDDGTYAGEALFETVKAGDKRLVGYAVDYGTLITTEFGSSRQNVREIHVENGTLNVRVAERQTRTYTIRNVDAKPKTLMLQQEAGDYTVVSPKPAERTATAYRFEVHLPASGTQSFQVEQERTTFTAIGISDATPQTLLTYVENENLSEKARSQLRPVTDLKSQIAALDAKINAVRAQITDATNDETRLRANINSLNKVAGEEGKVHAYSAQLATLEEQLASLRDQNQGLDAQKSQLQERLRDAIGKLNF